MIACRFGKVLSVTGSRPGLTEILVEIEGRKEKAINYDGITGRVAVGDIVRLNTTAVWKRLGTGGFHFVMAVDQSIPPDPPSDGHIMKLRYTPLQVKVHSVEEEDHPGNHLYRSVNSLGNTPVLVGTLHSMVAPAAAAIKHFAGHDTSIFYLMTDGAALPISISGLVHDLKTKGLLDGTVTCGHSFGGDFEAINIYSGLLWARAAGADAILVSMGPGIVGSASEYGHTALEQGEIINAVNILEGRAIAIPRISFADARKRHFGLSHHTRTALGKVALTGCTIPVPALKGRKRSVIYGHFKESGILDRHKVVEVDTVSIKDVMESYGLSVTTMGRTFSQDPEFFETAGAAGIYAAALLQAGADEAPDRDVTGRSGLRPKKNNQLRGTAGKKETFSGKIQSHFISP
ncbi:MAG: DUF3866 family protein [Bacillota bacterium]